MVRQHIDYREAAIDIVCRLGKKIVMAVPLGLGKPIGFINALYELASENEELQLTIITGLTLARPTIKNDLEKRFIDPILARLLKDFEDPLYEKARVENSLPKNIHIIEFFLSPGKFIKNNYVQQHYISSKYSNVESDALSYKINLYAQEIACVNKNENTYSLSCNTDLFFDVVKDLPKKSSYPFAIMGVVNNHLPILLNDALTNKNVFTDLIDVGTYKTLFSIPFESISTEDHMIGCYASALIKDDGCLQLGIGKMNNAIANAIIFRHQYNTDYNHLLKTIKLEEKFGDVIALVGENGVFNSGLYASTEMLSDEYMQLYQANILKKKVYDHIGIQRLLNNKLINEEISIDMIDVLLAENIIRPDLTELDMQFLQFFGIFNKNLELSGDNLILKTGEKLIANLKNNETRKKMGDFLGKKLIGGKIIHAAFFLGTAHLYSALRNLPLKVLQQINMTTIKRTNQLYWSYELLSLQRKKARFINSAMMITLEAESISDTLSNFKVISGVGGQFDFVNMAHDLHDARSIITCRSTRTTKNGVKSNIVWNYPVITIPRYLRDIVITEYGIADCRSKTDADVIKSLLNITDSRFQPGLLKEAKKSGKLPKNYTIPREFRSNYPANIHTVLKPLQAEGYFKTYPFGSDLTEDEMIIEQALLFLKKCNYLTIFVLIIRTILFYQSSVPFDRYLRRMQLMRPKNLIEWVYRRLFIYSLSKL